MSPKNSRRWRKSVVAQAQSAKPASTIPKPAAAKAFTEESVPIPPIITTVPPQPASPESAAAEVLLPLPKPEPILINAEAIDAVLTATAKQATAAQGPATKLPLKVAPFIVRELGINLYTSLARVLVEFVANAWDADANEVDIYYSENKIRQGMEVLKAQEHLEKSRRVLVAADVAPVQMDQQAAEEPAELTLDDSIQIIVKDRGQGMTLDELRDKFLFVGRRRREHEEAFSANGRVIMGRKGIGKLAGFGVAHRVTVITKSAASSVALKIEMKYEEIIAANDTNDIQIDAVPVDWTEAYPTGTTIILSRITAVSTKSRLKTVEETIAENFRLILGEFTIRVNTVPVTPIERSYDFVFPDPHLPAEQMVNHDYKPMGNDGPTYHIQYRIRFTAPGEHLKSEDRGIAIYAHNRLAAAPDTLNLTTGMHGFKNTSYLSGVLQADFIDDQKVDYIASNRQGVRWETPLLEPLRDFLTTQMEEAVKAYQKVKDGRAGDKAKSDPWTVKTIDSAGLPANRKRMAYKIAKAMIKGDPDEEKAPYYKAALPILINGLAQGTVMTAIQELAKQDHPDLHKVIQYIIRLTAREHDDAVLFVKSRVEGVRALKKIIDEADWTKPENERALQKLLERCPWIIDQMPPVFTADESLSSLVEKLAKYLKIAKYGEVKEPDTRPDLVFLLHSQGLDHIVIVELKSPNLELRMDHLTQLKKYMMHAREWLDGNSFPRTRVSGYLIGMLKPESKSADVQLLIKERDRYPYEEWKVYGLLELLDRSEKVHKDILDAADRADAADEDADDD